MRTYTYNDHCLFTANGQNFRVTRVSGGGRYIDLQLLDEDLIPVPGAQGAAAIDLSRIDFTAYCEAAVLALADRIDISNAEVIK